MFEDFNLDDIRNFDVNELTNDEYKTWWERLEAWLVDIMGILAHFIEYIGL